MKEKDYINAKALGTVTATINTLNDLVPANLDKICLESEYIQVFTILNKWQKNLYNSIKIK